MQPRRYETLIMLAPDLGDSFIEQFKAKVDNLIADSSGKIVRYDNWGRKRLAYPVNKQLFGHYVFFDFQGTKELSAELDRILKLDEKVFKFLTLLVDKEFTDEKFEKTLEELTKKSLPASSVTDDEIVSSDATDIDNENSEEDKQTGADDASQDSDIKED